MALCIGNKITIVDPKAGAYQCQDCRMCSPGEGLSVECGDVIGPNTPIVCERCVLGKTYSPDYEAGACKVCRDCSFLSKEMTKACTLTSNAECGVCKPGFYPDGFLGMCQPCFYCCNDGADISPPACAVAGVPENKRCSVYRSEKCGKLVSSSTISTKQTRPTLASSTPWKKPTVITEPTASSIGNTTTKVNTTQGQERALTQSSGSSLYPTVVPPVSAFLLILVLVAVCWGRKKKRNRKNKKFVKVPRSDDAEQAGSDDEEKAGSNDAEKAGSEADEESEDEKDQGADGSEESLEEDSCMRIGVEETECPLSTGVMESQPPGSYNQGVKLPVDAQPFSPPALSDNQSHAEETSGIQATVELSATISFNGNGGKDLVCSCQRYYPVTCSTAQ